MELIGIGGSNVITAEKKQMGCGKGVRHGDELPVTTGGKQSRNILE